MVLQRAVNTTSRSNGDLQRAAMSRKRSRFFSAVAEPPDLKKVFMDSAGQSDDDFADLGAEPELQVSVSEIADHLGRSISWALDAALRQIRRVVSARIRVLRLELQDKTAEIEVLRARLETAGSGPVSVPARGPAALGARPPPAGQPAIRPGDLRKLKAGAPEIKKEKVNAICDYLMKDKNARSKSGAWCGGAAPSGTDKERVPSSPPPLWAEPGPEEQPGGGAVEGGPVSEELFALLPSHGKLLDRYHGPDSAGDLSPGNSPRYLQPGVQLFKSDMGPAPSDPGDEGPPGDAPPAPAGGPAEQTWGPLGSAGDGVPIRAPEGVERLEGGGPGPRAQAEACLCPFCGTFCPSAAFLGEHLKAAHQGDAAGADPCVSPGGQGLERGRQRDPDNKSVLK
nr:PREDICTED: collagen alpha-1(III) chain-like [Lepisosteus oculatus]